MIVEDFLALARIVPIIMNKLALPPYQIAYRSGFSRYISR
jgi:hypothetical protein